MTAKRQIDIYSARCAICNDAVELVEDMACSSCEMKDMTDDQGYDRQSLLTVVQTAVSDALNAAGVANLLQARL